ncbi:MAG: ribosome-associated toxin RatA of RatAB toxin-antitoxin module [Lentisphaeria bacterium]|jgi:ribosome-associated toxin RatA of RatAB toxin-antitoxin module
MFVLVNDVERYPQFMPGCVAAQVLSRGENWLVARLDLSKAGVRHSFVTKNTYVAPLSMSLSLEEGPFSSFAGEWHFQPLSGSGCKIVFWLEFEFSSKLLNIATSKLFEKVASDQVDAVCKRAKQIYR